MAALENFVLYAAMGIMILTCAVQVLDNFIFNFGFMWTSEVLRIMLIWTICSGVSVAAGRREHLGVTFLLLKLPKNISKWVKLVTDILSVGVCTYIVISGIAYVTMQIETGAVFSITRWPQPVAQLAVPICFAFTAIRIVFTIISDFSPAQDNDIPGTAGTQEGGTA